MEEEQYKEILRRLSKLETHVINSIFPIQNVNNLIYHLSQPLNIDDRSLASLLREFRQKMAEFREDMNKVDLTQTLSELKFIGKKVNQIEKDLAEIKSGGVKKKVQVDVTIDGYCVKKEIKNDDRPDELIEDTLDGNSKDSLDDLLKTLTQKEKIVFTHRYGLFGEKKKTYNAIGKIFNVGLERARQIHAKAIRKCRHPSRMKYVEDLKHMDLKEAILDM